MADGMLRGAVNEIDLGRFEAYPFIQPTRLRLIQIVRGWNFHLSLCARMPHATLVHLNVFE